MSRFLKLEYPGKPGKKPCIVEYSEAEIFGGFTQAQRETLARGHAVHIGSIRTTDLDAFHAAALTLVPWLLENLGIPAEQGAA